MRKVTGGLGTDVLAGIEEMRGTDHADRFNGDSGNSVIDGRAGNDVFAPGAGTDVITGGSGVDAVTYSNTTSGVRVYLGQSAYYGAGAGRETIEQVENLTGSPYGDQLIGDLRSNLILGGAGAITSTASTGTTGWTAAAATTRSGRARTTTP